jgi:hypothetical protein
MVEHKTIREQGDISRAPQLRRWSYSAFPLRSLEEKRCELVVSDQRSSRAAAFTLAELLIAVGVLALLVLLATQLLNSAATITTLGHKQMDADSQARQLFDRLGIDFGQMVMRSDVDHYLKSSVPALDCVGCQPQPGNDAAVFYSMVPGYFTSPAPSNTQRSPVSVVQYRINSTPSSSSYFKMERLAKGLAWNGASLGSTPLWFLPQTILAAILSTNVSDYEIIGPQVFRFEYYYLLKGQTNPTTGVPYSPIFSDTPWDARICSCPTPTPNPNPTSTPTPTPTPVGTPTPVPTPPTLCCHTAIQGMQDVAAVVVDIAVIDPKSKVLLNDVQIATLAGQLVDYNSTMGPGQLRAQWQNTINAVSLPPQARSGIRVYERYLYLSPPTLLTP